MAYKTRLKVKKLDGKDYYFRQSDAKYFHDKKFLGWDDAEEIAINKQLARERRKNNGI